MTKPWSSHDQALVWMMTFDEHLRQMELNDGRTQEVNRSLALAFFFLVNLMLAVIGTVIPAAKIVRTRITNTLRDE